MSITHAEHENMRRFTAEMIRFGKESSKLSQRPLGRRLRTVLYSKLRCLRYRILDGKRVAAVADHVVAIDVSPETLDIAKAKGLPFAKVEFRIADAYALDKVEGTFDAGMANFWLSHVPKQAVGAFLDGFHKRVGPGARVFMADNVYVPGIGGELIVKPGTQDTFKLRTLADGDFWSAQRRTSRVQFKPRFTPPAWTKHQSGVDRRHAECG